MAQQRADEFMEQMRRVDRPVMEERIEGHLTGPIENVPMAAGGGDAITGKAGALVSPMVMLTLEDAKMTETSARLAWHLRPGGGGGGRGGALSAEGGKRQRYMR